MHSTSVLRWDNGESLKQGETRMPMNLTTHVALVLDRSISMGHLTNKTIQVADELVAFLAEQSKKMGQEWRVSVYSFGSSVDCHIWDMDVLRLPSMKEHYKIDGNTALIDAVNIAFDDGDRIPEHRGDHAHLVYVITDGEENWSTGALTRRPNGYPALGAAALLTTALRKRLAALADNRTVGVFVPDARGRTYMQDLGFNNIEIWDATSEAGMEEAARTIQASATTYMEARTQGVDGLRSMKKGGLFVGGNINAATVKAADLKPLPTSARQIVIVTKTKDAFEKVVKPVTKSRLKPEMGTFVEIEKFVNLAYPPFRVGKAYYELVKSETIQGDKEIAVVDVNTNKVYVGAGARQLLGLPEEKRRVKPEENGQYKIYVQSSSLNRHLPLHSHVLLLTS